MTSRVVKVRTIATEDMVRHYAKIYNSGKTSEQARRSVAETFMRGDDLISPCAATLHTKAHNMGLLKKKRKGNGAVAIPIQAEGEERFSEMLKRYSVMKPTDPLIAAFARDLLAPHLSIAEEVRQAAESVARVLSMNVSDVMEAAKKLV